MQIEWWHWITAGVCLIGLELIVPSFTIIWFGFGALFVGALSGLWPGFSPVAQLALWLFASICFSLMWYKYLKPGENLTNAGMSKGDIVGESGIIIRGTEDGSGQGIVIFHVSSPGADEWSCYSSEILHVGDRVRVVDREGQILKVEII